MDMAEGAESEDAATLCVAKAQVYATLAIAAATWAMTRREEVEV